MQNPSREHTTGSNDDIGLIRLLQEQPLSGTAALYARYGGAVFSVALRIVGDRGAAEEITQDVFVMCWRNAARYCPEQGSLITWLFSITHHRAIDELRSRRYLARTREATLEETMIVGGTRDQEIDLRLLQEAVRSALAALPSGQREVIELLYYGDLTRQEAADRLQVPLGTIHTRLRLGMAKLRNALAHVREEETTDDPMPNAERIRSSCQGSIRMMRWE